MVLDGYQLPIQNVEWIEQNTANKWKKKRRFLPQNISWLGVLEEKLTPSEDTTGRWTASTTGCVRKGFKFGMESSTASVEVKGSAQAEGKRRKEKREMLEEDMSSRTAACSIRLMMNTTQWSPAHDPSTDSGGWEWMGWPFVRTASASSTASAIRPHD